MPACNWAACVRWRTPSVIVFLCVVSANYAVASGVIFYVGVGAAIGTILLLAFIVVVCFVRGRKTTVNSAWSVTKPSSRLSRLFSTVWVKKIPRRGPDIFHFFHKRLRIFNRFFTHLLHIPIYARLQIFIQLSPILTKLCHIKRDYPVHKNVHHRPKYMRSDVCVSRW